MAEVTYEIVDTIGVLSTASNGWRMELNLIRWNGAEPKYDVRKWSEDHEKMSKGITMTAEELQSLADILKHKSPLAGA